jgi:hypothetical protein
MILPFNRAGRCRSRSKAPRKRIINYTEHSLIIPSSSDGAVLSSTRLAARWKHTHAEYRGEIYRSIDRSITNGTALGLPATPLLRGSPHQDTGSQNSLIRFWHRTSVRFEVVLGCWLIFFRAQIVAHYFAGGSGRMDGAGEGAVRGLSFIVVMIGSGGPGDGRWKFSSVRITSRRSARRRSVRPFHRANSARAAWTAGDSRASISLETLT